MSTSTTAFDPKFSPTPQKSALRNSPSPILKQKQNVGPAKIMMVSDFDDEINVKNQDEISSIPTEQKRVQLNTESIQTHTFERYIEDDDSIRDKFDEDNSEDEFCDEIHNEQTFNSSFHNAQSIDSSSLDKSNSNNRPLPIPPLELQREIEKASNENEVSTENVENSSSSDESGSNKAENEILTNKNDVDLATAGALATVATDISDFGANLNSIDLSEKLGSSEFFEDTSDEQLPNSYIDPSIYLQYDKQNRQDRAKYTLPMTFTDNQDDYQNSLSSVLKKFGEHRRYQTKENINIVFARSNDSSPNRNQTSLVPRPMNTSSISGTGKLDGYPLRSFQDIQKSLSKSRSTTSMSSSEKEKLSDNSLKLNPTSQLLPGKLFVKILCLYDIDLHFQEGIRYNFRLALDNGKHKVLTSYLPLNDTKVQINQEFDLTACDDDLRFTLTLQMKYQPPITPKSRNSIVNLLSPKKLKKVAESDRFLDSIVAMDGSFGKSEHFLKSLKKCAQFRVFKENVEMRNEWALDENSKKDQVGLRKPPYKIGTMSVQYFYIPPLPLDPDSNLPQSTAAALTGLRKLSDYRLWLSTEIWHGFLSQKGGDCSFFRRRLFRIKGNQFLAFHETDRSLRYNIDLSTVKHLIYEPNQQIEDDGYMIVQDGFRLRLMNNESIEFLADDYNSKMIVVEALLKVIGKKPRIPSWTNFV